MKYKINWIPSIKQVGNTWLYFLIIIYDKHTNDDVVYFTVYSWAMQVEKSWRARPLVSVSYTKQSAKLYWTMLSLHDVAETILKSSSASFCAGASLIESNIIILTFSGSRDGMEWVLIVQTSADNLVGHKITAAEISTLYLWFLIPIEKYFIYIQFFLMHLYAFHHLYRLTYICMDCFRDFVPFWALQLRLAP